MKAAVRLLVRFLIWFVTIIAVAGALAAAHGYVTGFDPARTVAPEPLVPLFLAGIAQAWIPVTLLAAVLSLFAAVRAEAVPRVTMPALFALWTLTLFAGGFVLAVVPPAASNPPVLPPQRIVRVETWRLYPLRAVGTDPVPLVLHDERDRPAFQVRGARHPGPQAAVLELPGDPRSPIDLEGRIANSYPSMVRPPHHATRLRADIGETARLLALDGPLAVPTILTLAAFAFFVLGCWTVVRLTRWPLFNAALALGCLRLALWIVPASRTGALRPVLIAALDSTILPIAPAVILTAIGLGLLAVLVFLPSYAEWRRETRGGLRNG